MMLAKTTRKGLLDFAFSPDPRKLPSMFGRIGELARDLSGDELLLVFEDDFPEFNAWPKTIITADKNVEDFLAWASTYLEQMSPFTSFVEVQGLREATERVELTNDIASRVRSSFAAILLCQAVAIPSKRDDHDDFLVTRARQTLSAVMAQGILEGLAGPYFSDIATLWMRLRSALGTHEATFQNDQILQFWAVMLSSLNRSSTRTDNPALADACAKFLSSGDLHGKWISVFGPNAAAVAQTLSSAVREERLRLVREFFASKTAADIPEILRAPMTGWMLALLADSDITLWRLAADISGSIAIVWFAFFAGSGPNSNALTAFRSAGRRIMDSLHRDTVFDIDGREVVISSRLSPATPFNFRRSIPGVARIRLSRNVVGWFQIPQPFGASEERKRDASSVAPDGNIIISKDSFRKIEQSIRTIQEVLMERGASQLPPVAERTPRRPKRRR